MKRVTVKLSFFIVLLITTVSIATPTQWEILQPGLEYTEINKLSGFHTGHIHAFRIDLNKFNLKMALAEDQHNKIATVEDLTLANKGIIGINGGFFSQELKPLGLRISNHSLRNPLKATPWWGVFYIANNRAYITSQKAFKPNSNIEFAVQSGPRLITNNKILSSLKSGVDSRTALGINKHNQVLLVVTENLTLTTTQLAKIMKASSLDGGLECQDALNLDGGSSTQVFANTGKFTLTVPSFSAVTDAIVVVPRN